MRLSDTALGFVLMVAAAAVFAYAATFPAPVLQAFGPAFFPQLLSVLLGLAGLVLLIGGLRQQRPVLTLPAWWSDRRRRLNVALVPASALLYILASPALGFVPCALIILAGLAWRFGATPGRALLMAVAATATMHVVFVEVLAVPLPWGLLEPLLTLRSAAG